VSSVRVIGEPPDPAVIFRIYEEEAMLAGREAVTHVTDTLREATPRDSGETADAVRGSLRRNGDGHVGTVRFGKRAYIVNFLTRGTRRHRINPRTGRLERSKRAALDIPGVGFRGSAEHPGTDANPFVAETDSKVQPELARIYDRAAARAAKRTAQL